jgi:predicted regulator of Ras-like GTPase activity (Roadblock/LC7/MglB family)
MFKIVRRKNLVFFLLALVLGIGLGIYVPSLFPDKMVEVPYIALYAGEIGLSLLLALLVYESASTLQSLRLAAALLGFIMLIGGVINSTAQVTQMLPENFVLISWIQLAFMNVFGVACCLGFLKLEPTERYHVVMGQAHRHMGIPEPGPAPETYATRSVAPRQAVEPEDFSPPEESAKPQAPAAASAPSDSSVPAAPGESAEAAAAASAISKAESAKDILEKLNVDRINQLEKSLNPEQMSLETLFDEHTVAAPGKGKDRPVSFQMKGRDLSSPPKDPAITDAEHLLKTQIDAAAESDLGQAVEAMRQVVEPVEKIAQPVQDKPKEPSDAQESAQQVVATTGIASADAPLKIFEKNIADDIDKLFAGVSDDAPAPKAAETQAAFEQVQAEPFAAPVVTPVPSVEEAQAPPPQTKFTEYDRLSLKGKAPLEGHAAGSMRTIGKMLLDVKAVENIINGGESRGLHSPTACVINTVQGQIIQDMLRKINTHPGVSGSLIVGHDGLVMASTIEQEMEAMSLGALSLAIYNHTHSVSKKLSWGKFKQTILTSQDKVAILTDTDRGILAVFSDKQDFDKLSGLLEALQTVAFV